MQYGATLAEQGPTGGSGVHAISAPAPTAHVAVPDEARRDQQRPEQGVAQLGRWLAIAVLGFTVGAATILLVDAGGGAERVVAAPAGAASPDPSVSGAGQLAVHEHNHVVTGVKAQDIAAESQPDKPLDRATRAELAAQLAAARAVAMRYPTVADATAAGYDPRRRLRARERRALHLAERHLRRRQRSTSTG